MPPFRPPSSPSSGGRPSGKPRPTFRRRSRPRNAAPELVAGLLPQLVARLGGDDRAAEQRISLVWAEAVGPMLAKHTRPEGVRGKTLMVKVSSSSYAHELVLLRREILDRLTKSMGAPVVEEIRSRVGVID
jgi:predicted nucleic acid-binding Zn ribbon protein